MSCVVVTGYTRGLGQALANGIPTELGVVFVGRKTPESMSSNQTFVQWDMSQPLTSSIKDQLEQAIQKAGQGCVSHVLHSAGLVGPLGAAVSGAGESGKAVVDFDYLQQSANAHMVNTLNFSALVDLCLPFILKGEENSERVVFHFSSGAALNAYGDLGAYCSSKAGALMYSKTLHAAFSKQGLRVLSVAPGTVETDMTRPLANSSEAKLPGLAKFRELKETGGYADAKVVGAQIAEIVFADSKSDLRTKISGEYYDIRKPL